ncbi:MAG: sugar phosphate isomerase/epimerase family protein [Rhizobiaceae bacterium]
MNWSFQLYSARNFTPWDKVLKVVAAAGYKQVEGFGGVYDDPKALRAELDANGLTMPTGHFSIDQLEGDFAGAQKIAETLGVKVMVCPWIAPDVRPTDAAGWTAFGKRLGKVGETVRKAGYEFAWHNHDFEMKTLPDGSVPQTLIMDAAPEIGWEMDVAWVVRGGADPLPWIDRYGRRIVAVHVKDIARAGENLDEDGWSDVGHGTVPWKQLMAALGSKSAARYYVMEQDNPNDIERFARRSIEAANGF